MSLPTDHTIGKTFYDVYIALCSNPTVVTLMPKNNHGLLAKTQQPELMPVIQPFLAQLAFQLTSIYLLLDEEACISEVKKNLEHMKKTADSLINNDQNLRNGAL